MIERILEQEGAITKVLSSDKKTRHLVFTLFHSDPVTSDISDMATFVDPRFKDEYIPRDRVDALKQKVVEEDEGIQPDPAVHSLSEPVDQCECRHHSQQ